MATECIEESVSVPVFEVMTELNSRSTFGRIVVNPPSRMAALKVHQTGEAWYFCQECGRGFLQQEKMLQHKEEHKNDVKDASIEATIKREKGISDQSNPSRLTSSFKKGTFVRSDRDYSGCIKTENGHFQCRLCSKVFRRPANYFIHSLRHKNARPHKCLQCGAGFNHRSYLKFHIKRSHSLLHNFQCRHCTCRFETQLGLRRHCEMYHEGNAFLSQDTEAETLKAKSPIKMMNPQRDFKHEVTSLEKARKKNNGLKFVNSKAELFSRISNAVVANSIRAQLPSRWKSRSQIPKNLNPSISGPPFECSICHKILARATTFKQHLLIHTGERPYLCKHCGMRFRLYTTLSSHIKSAHFGGGSFRCPYCECSYKTNSVLSRHIQKVHEDF